MSPAIPAATLVLLRERAGGPPELLMIERAGGMAFAAGAFVFPGGRIDPGDHALAAGLLMPGDDPMEMAARVAAIRETIEEVGIAVGLLPAPDAAAVARIRAGIATTEFAALIAREGLSIDPAALTAFARWVPDIPGKRRFDTWFFLAAAPAGCIATADGGESVQVLWGTGEALLREADAGRHPMIYPTRRNLERVAGFTSLADGKADAARFPPVIVTPWREERDGASWLCIPDDRGYPVTAQPVATARRG